VTDLRLSLWDLLLGVVSVIGLVSAFKIEDSNLRILLGLALIVILLVFYLMVYINNIKTLSEFAQKEVNRLNEKIKIHEILDIA